MSNEARMDSNQQTLGLDATTVTSSDNTSLPSQNTETKAPSPTPAALNEADRVPDRDLWDEFIRDNNSTLEPTEFRSGETKYRKITLPAGFTIPTRSVHHASLTFPSPSICLYFTSGAAGREIDRILRSENCGPRKVPFTQKFEGDRREWLKDAVEAWWGMIGYTARDSQMWEAFGAGIGCLVLMSQTDPVFGPCRDRLLLGVQHIVSRAGEMHNLYQSQRHITKETRSNKEGFWFMRVLLPAGFTLPSDLTCAGSPILKTGASIYHFPTGMIIEDLYRFLCREAKVPRREATITRIRSPKHKTQLEQEIEDWWTTMGVEAEDVGGWNGFQRGDTYIVSEHPSAPDVKTAGTSRPESGHFKVTGAQDAKSRDVTGDSGRLQNEPTDQSTEACGSSPLPPLLEAWKKLAKFLQTRNRYLEHQVRELQEINGSLTEDVQWHVEALERAEEQVQEAQFERAIALAEALDLKAKFAPSADYGASTDNGSSDQGYECTDMTSSGSGTSFSDSGMEDTRECGYGSQRGEELTCETTSERESLVPEHARRVPADIFYFFPKASLILLMTSPPRFYQWPLNTTLQQIYKYLIRRHNAGIQEDPVLEVMDILDIRQLLGVQLSGPTQDEVIKISIPDLNDLPSPDHKASIAAREAFNTKSSLNDQAWENWWYSVAQPSLCSSLDCTCSDLALCEDEKDPFGDWSWGVDAAGLS